MTPKWKEGKSLDTIYVINPYFYISQFCNHLKKNKDIHKDQANLNLAGERVIWNIHMNAGQANISLNVEGVGDQETHTPRLQLIQTPQACSRLHSPFRSLSRQLSPEHDLEV